LNTAHDLGLRSRRIQRKGQHGFAIRVITVIKPSGSFLSARAFRTCG